jgi:hypothetical protein
MFAGPVCPTHQDGVDAATPSAETPKGDDDDDALEPPSAAEMRARAPDLSAPSLIDLSSTVGGEGEGEKEGLEGVTWSDDEKEEKGEEEEEVSARPTHTAQPAAHRHSVVQEETALAAREAAATRGTWRHAPVAPRCY